LQIGTVIAERFECQAFAGSGGMGSVYRAHDRLVGRTVAIKILHDSAIAARDRFVREAELLLELRHPAIVGYIAHGVTAEGRPYLALEWLEGEDLGARLARGRMRTGDALTIARRVADALAAAHARGIVHRDIKPSNLFLPGSEPGRVTLLDFGIARLLGGLRAGTRTGMVVGTPGYMAPEQARGERHIDARADVFSLGCVLFECLTGQPPFFAEHLMAVLAKILLEEVPRAAELAADVPAALDDLVARMMAKQPGERPAHGAAVVAELDALVLGDASARPSAQRPASLTGDERRLLAVVIAGAGEPTEDPARAATIAETGARDLTLTTLDAAVAPLGGRLERFADGSVLVALQASGSATDLAARAARCALALRARLPGAAIAVATGKAVVSARLPIGEVIDRAVRALRASAPDAARSICLDETTAGLLDTGFDIGGEGQGLVLRGEREVGEAPRMLLGKPTPVVGRDRELAALDSVFAECVSDQLAQVVLVTAAAGMGKSRLRAEFLRRLRERDDAPDVWIGRGDPMAMGVPLGLLGQAARRVLGQVASDALEVRRQKLRARVGRHALGDDLQRVVEFVGELCGTPFDDAGSLELRAARSDALAMGERMQQAWLRWLSAECSARPVVLVLEDLHWGDSLTVKFVDAALRALAERPFMVLAMARPDVHERFSGLWSGRGLHEIQLRELGRKPAERLVRKVLGEDTPERLVTQLVDRAGGNAFYLEELIRAASQGLSARLPETVLAMVQARLEALPDEHRRVLRAASVFGDSFLEPGVAELMGERARTGLPSMLAQLVDGELVTRRSDRKLVGVAEYVFRHDLVRQAAYASLTEQDRLLGHKLAAGWLEREAGADPSVIADHLRLGGSRAEAAAWYRRAAQHALEVCDLDAALACIERGVECGASGGDLGRLRLLEADTLFWRGEFARAEHAALAAEALLEPGSRDWYAAIDQVAQASGTLGHAEQVERAAAALGAPPTDLLEHWLYAAAGASIYQLLLGNFALGSQLLARLEGCLVPEPGLLLEARVAAARAVRALLQQDPGGYLRFELLAADAYRRAGQVQHAAEHDANVAYAHLLFGAYERAAELLSSALPQLQALGLQRVAAGARQNLALALARSGRPDEAIAMGEQAAAELHATGDLRLEGTTHVYIALALEESGGHARAADEARVAIDILAGVPLARGQALAVLARAQLSLGDVAGALASAAQGMALLAEQGTMEEGEAYLRLVHADALAASGRADEARAGLAIARRNLEAAAARISDEALRASFLARIPEHARILAVTVAP